MAPALPTMIPHCGPPSSLSPENSTRSAPAAIAFGDERFITDPGWHARAPGHPNRCHRSSQAMAVGKLNEAGQRCLLGEADDPEVAVVNPQDGGRLGTDRPLVVG